ncbi:unnamed protein product [Fusarium graminearum]|nr:hypothetical protein FG05_03220 [Fusarium graminearum]KAI6771323.1 hypothetical protein HG531_008948 [Fusarium graminearum]CAG1976840.1 unnamed protein product [Fusarium graminearum]CAG2009085.1 unnamed protein product [Fusarium graminearum]VTO84528.1 unnamed protein product [Fusarium graminearum]
MSVRRKSFEDSSVLRCTFTAHWNWAAHFPLSFMNTQLSVRQLPGSNTVLFVANSSTPKTTPGIARMATFNEFMGYLLEPLLFIAPYPYLAFYPTYTAARHVRSISMSAADERTSGIMAQENNPSLFNVIYPTRGILLWFMWSFPRQLAIPFLAKHLPVCLGKCITMIVSAPVQLLWLHAVLSDTPLSLSASTRYLRSITAIQWLQFIATILSFCLIEETIELAIDESLKLFIGHEDLSGDINTSEARSVVRIIMAHYALSKAVKLVLWVPATVAAVQAAPDIHRGERGQVTNEFCASMVDCMKSMPLSLWVRCGIYYSVAAAIGVLTKVVDGAFVVHVKLGGEKTSQLGDLESSK